MSFWQRFGRGRNNNQPTATVPTEPDLDRDNASPVTPSPTDSESERLQTLIDSDAISPLVSLEPNPRFYHNFVVFDDQNYVRGHITLDGAATSQRQHDFETAFGLKLERVAKEYPPLPENKVYVFRIESRADEASPQLMVWFGPDAHDIFQGYIMEKTFGDGVPRFANAVYPPY